MRHVAPRDHEPPAKPLTEPVLLILLSLAAEPRHGYGLRKDIEALSSRRVCLSTGTLYGALSRLLDDQWIERFDQEDTSRDKQAYRLTKEGRRHLEAEIARLRQLMRAAKSRMRVKEA